MDYTKHNEKHLYPRNVEAGDYIEVWYPIRQEWVKHKIAGWSAHADDGVYIVDIFSGITPNDVMQITFSTERNRWELLEPK